MRTYSHLIVTAAAAKCFAVVPAYKRALLLGSIVPDLPLTILTTGYFALKALVKTQPSTAVTRDFKEICCTDPTWVISYNFFHAPLILAVLLGIGYQFGMKRDYSWAKLVFWFAIGCAGHSAIDMVTHHDDGPLVFFPLDWQTRINSPVSYWDTRHRGLPFTILEHIVAMLLVFYLLTD